MEARVTAMSQTFKLRERMEEARILHGQEVRADVPSVNVAAVAAGVGGQIFFCNMGQIRVREILNLGDHGPLPTNVAVEGLEVSASGNYDILNALICSNGDVRLVVDSQASIVPANRIAGGVPV